MLRLESKYTKYIVSAAIVISIIVVGMAVWKGKDSGPEIFISGVGALGQVWIAVMLFILTVKQFAYQKSADASQEKKEEIFADLTDRSQNFDRRYSLMDKFNEYKKRIGVRDFDLDQVRLFRTLRADMRLIFGPDVGETMNASLAQLTTAVKAEREYQELLKIDKEAAGDEEVKKSVETLDAYKRMANALGSEKDPKSFKGINQKIYFMMHEQTVLNAQLLSKQSDLTSDDGKDAEEAMLVDTPTDDG